MSVELKAQKREVFGRKLNSLRKQNLIPAELYGRGIENVHLTVLAKEFKKAFEEAGENTVVSLSIGHLERSVAKSKDLIKDDKSKVDEISRHLPADATALQAGARNDSDVHPVLIYNIHRHPVTDDILSVDFYQVKMDEVVQTEVPLVFIGESLAVKDQNGILVKVMQEVEVEALPADMPRQIDVDVSKLEELDSSLHVSDLLVPNNVKILSEPENVVVSVKPQMTEEEAKALEEEGAAPTEEVEVEGEETASHPETEPKDLKTDSSQAQNDEEKEK
ncbi:MAG: 50S ribosomal protein L25 [Patescibacteria group bacterium]